HPDREPHPGRRGRVGEHDHVASLAGGPVPRGGDRRAAPGVGPPVRPGGGGGVRAAAGAGRGRGPRPRLSAARARRSTPPGSSPGGETKGSSPAEAGPMNTWKGGGSTGPPAPMELRVARRCAVAKGRILVVDDEIYIVHILDFSLGMEGYEVLTALDGE